MKRSAIITSFICLLAASTATAQNSVVGIKGGLNLSSLTTDGTNDKALNPGFHAGLFSRMAIGEVFAIQPELLFSVKGTRITYDGLVEGETRYNLNYIDLPVKLVFNLSENFSLHAGPYVGYLVNANFKTEAEVLDLFDIDDADEINRKNFNEFDYGVVGGLEFKLIPLLIGVSYNLGLNPVAAEGNVSRDLVGDARNTVIQLYVGIQF